MTHDPVMLAAKIIKRIGADGTTNYAALEARAKELEVPDAIFQAAMTIVHRSKKIERKVKGDDIVYSVKVVKEPVVHTGAAWVTANYPWPENFEMPFPEIDLSHIFLRGEEREKYKAEAKGRVYIPKQKYEYARG